LVLGVPYLGIGFALGTLSRLVNHKLLAGFICALVATIGVLGVGVIAAKVL
jgi:hypothetical protein